MPAVFAMAILTLLIGGVTFSANNLAAAQGNHQADGGIMLMFLVSLACLVATLVLLFRRLSRNGREAAALSSGDRRKCPHCAEIIRAEAKVCKHCGRDVPLAVEPGFIP